MTAITTYVLFPDAREASGGGAALGNVFPEMIRSPGGQITIVDSFPAAETLAELTDLPWHYPLLIIYRTDGEDRWSFTRVLGGAGATEES